MDRSATATLAAANSVAAVPAQAVAEEEAAAVAVEPRPG
jgi:hypothetical protein